MTSVRLDSENAPLFDRALIIGSGLIGGSIGHGLIYHQVCHRVIGYDLNPSHLAQALERGLIEEIAPTLEGAIRSAELIVIAVPVGKTLELVKQLALYAQPNTLIVDSGSVKVTFSQECTQFLSTDLRQHVIPCHPIAGHVTSGPEHANQSLMAGNLMIMTPLAETNNQSLDKAHHMWQRLGFETLIMTVQEHDAIYAKLSHMPHILAFTLMKYISDSGLSSTTLKKLAGNAFKDMTHHAGQNAYMWSDIFHMNQEEIFHSLAGFRDSLNEIERVIRNPDTSSLQQELSQIQKQRFHLWS